MEKTKALILPPEFKDFIILRRAEDLRMGLHLKLLFCPEGTSEDIQKGLLMPYLFKNKGKLKLFKIIEV